MTILSPGYSLTLRPMRYPQFFEMYRNGIKNTWTVDEVDFASDVEHLAKLTSAELHMVRRLVAFFATGDSIVSNNLVLNLYQNINSPEARMYLSRQLYEEALHVQFYLTLLDTYIPNIAEREAAFQAVETVPSIALKARFMDKWMHREWDTPEEKLMNLVVFACAVEGLFFFAAFAYVYFLRSRGMLHGLATGTNWVFRDESAHMAFAFEVVRVARTEGVMLDRYDVAEMMRQAVDCETNFARDLLGGGVSGLSVGDMRLYLESVADARMVALGFPPIYGTKNPLSFMELQDVQELANFFERRVSAYQSNVTGEVTLNGDF